MGAQRKTRRGKMLVEKQEWFGRLIAQGVGPSEVCRIVGINRRTGTRWRYGRTIRNSAGEAVYFSADRAGVSRSWLYAHPELRDQLRRLTAMSETGELAPARVEHGSDASLRQRLALAHERIRDLDNENHRLRGQVAHLHGQLRASRIASNIDPSRGPPCGVG